MRLVLMTIGLAPLVTVVLLGLSRVQRDAPEWVYWQAELVFLIALEFVYAVAAMLAACGAFALGVLLFRARGSSAKRPILARGLMLCVATLGGLAISEFVCAGRISRSHRFTAVPVGGLATDHRNEPSSRFAGPVHQVDLRTEFPGPPGDREIDIVVLGESSAEGVPYNRWVSIGKLVAWKLEQAIPGRPIRLNSIARSGDTLEKQHEALSNLARRPDLLIIYCGHNEFYSRLWWARDINHYVLDEGPGRWPQLVEKVERFSSVCALIRMTADQCRLAIPPPSDTTRELVDVPSYTATEYRLLLADFRHRLDELVSYAEQIGALPVLVLPPANDTDFEPNRSFLPPLTTRADREAFGADFLAARRLETVDKAKALAQYRALLARQPWFAETHYRLARLLQEAGDWNEAYGEYIVARDLDGMPMRCPSPFQEAYREVAARHDCILIDGQSYFHTIGRHGLLDDELFQDAMHPSLRGHIALAQAVLVAMRTRRAFGWPKGSAVPIIDPAECVTHFGIDVSAWRQIAMWWKGFNELTFPLRYDPSLRLRKKESGLAAAAKIDAGIAPEAVGLPNVGTPAAVPIVSILAVTPADRPRAPVDFLYYTSSEAQAKKKP